MKLPSARAFARMFRNAQSKTADREQEAAGRRRAEAELEQRADRERLCSAAVESSIDAVITETLDGVVTSWNPAAEQLFGLTAAEMIGQSIGTIAPGERRAEMQALLGMVRRGETVQHYQTVRLTKEGKEVDVSLSISPIKSPEGVIIGACKIARDVTEQRTAEEKFHLAVEASPSGILMTDLTGHIVMVNSEVEKQFGYQRDELIGRSVDDLLPENMRARHFASRRKYNLAPTTRHMQTRPDLRGRRKDGTEFPVEIGLNPIETREGPLILSVIIDITDRKRLDRMKDEFVSTVSHELRTPLTSIAGALGLLLGAAAGEFSESSRRLLLIAHSNSQRLSKLVNDILDIEKLESGQVSFKFKLTDIRTLIEQAIEGNRGYADTYLIRLRADIAAEGDVWIDPDRLSQVLANLISNAIKFSPPDGEVVVAAERHDDTLRISVRDLGAGIPPEFKLRVFQKFAQADGTNTKKTGGTGLGLSIVKEIVTRLGGEVGFDDAPGGGTIFYVDLPSAVPAEQPVGGASGRKEIEEIKVVATALRVGLNVQNRYS
jgi:PAS domain S-box-containing protein